MSWQAVDAVLKHSKSKNSARLVLIAIASHAKPNGTGSFPGEEMICDEANLSERAVKYAISELETENELTIERNSQGHILRYAINLPIKQKIEQDRVQGLHPQEKEQGAKSARSGCKIRKPRVQNLSNQGAKFASPPAPPIRNNRIEPSIAADAQPVSSPEITTKHPAITFLHSLTRRYPDKALWPKIVKVLGEEFDSVRLMECYATWIERGYNKVNYGGWLFGWYVNGIPENQNGRASPGKPKTQAELNAGGTGKLVQ